MIQKVAMGQAFRLAYPSLYAGMYDAAEITQGADLPADAIIIDQSPPVQRADYGYREPAVNRDTGEIVEAGAELCRECRDAPALDNSAYCGACESLLLGDQQPAMMPVSDDARARLGVFTRGHFIPEPCAPHYTFESRHDPTYSRRRTLPGMRPDNSECGACESLTGPR